PTSRPSSCPRSCTSPRKGAHRMKIKRRPTRLEKKAKRGHRGFPAGTLAFYGPDASRASNVAVGIIPYEDAEASALECWTSETDDVRHDLAIADEIHKFLEKHGVKSVGALARHHRLSS